MADPIGNSDSRHTTKIRGMLDEIIQHVRSDIGNVENPKIRALYKTTAEVLSGLTRAFEHAEKKVGSDWRYRVRI